MNPLPINKIREIARELNLTEIQHKPANNVIAFRGGPSHAKRINVWYTTGTVGTYIDHPRQGKTQLFRRGVDLALLRKIFANPRHHTGVGYKTRRGRASRSQSRTRSHSRDNLRSLSRARRGRSRSTCRRGRDRRTTIHDDDDDASSIGTWASIRSSHRARHRHTNYTDVSVRSSQRAWHPTCGDDDANSIGSWLSVASGRSIISAASSYNNMNNFVTEEEAAKKQKRRLQKEMQALKREMKIVQGILNDCQRQRREEESKRKKSLILGEEREKRGNRFMTNLSSALSDNICHHLGPNTLVVALGDNSQAVVMNEGLCFGYTSGVPSKVINLLTKRPSHASPPRYISLGSMDRYFLEVENGKCWFNGPPSMGDIIRRRRKSVKSVAYGEDFGTFFIVWESQT